MEYSLDFSWLGDAASLIGNGALMTILLIVVSSLFGTLISVLGAAGRRSGYAAVRNGVAAYVELIRNTPFLVQLFFIFFGLPTLGQRLNPVVSPRSWR